MDEYNPSTQYGDLKAAVDRAKKHHAVPMSGGAKAMLAGLGILAAAGLGGGIYALVQRNAEQKPDEYVAGQFLVKFEDEISVNYGKDSNAITGLDEIDKLNTELKGESYEQVSPHSDQYELDNWYVVDIDDSLDLESWMEKFEGAEGVEAVTYNAIFTIPYEIPELTAEQIQALEDMVAREGPNDPLYGSKDSFKKGIRDMWGLHQTNAAGAWETTTGSDTIIIGVVDTGVDYNHEDIAARMLRDENGKVIGYDFINNDDDPYDDMGHGTHVAGTIAATTNNGIGVAGVSWQGKILAVKVLDASGRGSFQAVADGIRYAADMGADVVNMSLGARTGPYQKIVDEAIDYAVSKGTIIIAAAGNSNEDAMRHTPANNPHVITIAATTPEDTRASFSNWGEKVDVGAPGTLILSLLARDHKFGNRVPVVAGKYTVLQGTSMACPNAVGEAVLILAANPELAGDVEAVRAVMRAGVDTISPDRYIGTGRINHAKAVAEATKEE